MTRKYAFAKRALDIIASACGLIVSAPLQAVIAFAIRATMGRPVLFRQVRPGLHERPFELIKFRTMLNVDAARGLVDDSSRLTSLGRLLRSTSLDELPSLWNVLRGDMSLVGPRPLRLHYLPYYTPRQASRHLVRPGLTGLAQVNGRNQTTWEDRLEYDAVYVENASFWLDLQILAKTVGLVVRREGITHDAHATMAPFPTKAGDDNGRR